MQKPKIETGRIVKDAYGVFQTTILVNDVEVCKEYAESETALHTQIAESSEFYIILYKGIVE